MIRNTPAAHSEGQASDVFNFAASLTEVFQVGNKHQTVAEETICNLFERFTHSDEQFGLEAISKYCFVDPTKNYTRNLIVENEHFSLMVLVWNPHAKSSIHAHGNSQCWLRVMKGGVTEKKWKCDPNSTDDLPLTPTHVNNAIPNDILYIDDSKGVHCIENNEEPTISLHCYAPPYRRCKCYCEKTGKQFTGTATFDSEYGTIKNKNLVHFDELYGEDEK